MKTQPGAYPSLTRGPSGQDKDKVAESDAAGKACGATTYVFDTSAILGPPVQGRSEGEELADLLLAWPVLEAVVILEFIAKQTPAPTADKPHSA